MESIPTGTFDEIRSYLTFWEIHRTRATAKQWYDIDNVDKTMIHSNYIGNLNFNFIPFTASTEQVTTYNIMGFGHPNYMDLTCRVLQQNSRSLKKIKIDTRNEFPPIFAWRCPEFPNVTELCLVALPQNSSRMLMGRCPNLRKLSCPAVSSFSTIDLAMFPTLEEIEISQWIHGLQNTHEHLKKITLVDSQGWTIAIDWISEYVRIPNIIVAFELYHFAHKIEMHTNSEAKKALITISGRGIGDNFHTAETIALELEFLEALKEIVDFDMELDICNMSKQMIFPLMHQLSTSSKFDKETLLAMMGLK